MLNSIVEQEKKLEEEDEALIRSIFHVSVCITFFFFFFPPDFG